MSAETSSARPLVGLPLWATGVLLAAANLMAVLDTSIANVSVPNITGALGASSSQGVWVITSYSVAEAITVPLTGWLAGRFGAVRVFVLSMLGFGLFSALCGIAPSLPILVLFRVLQGFSGGPLMPLSQTLLLTVFPKEKQPAAMGLWAVTTLVAPIGGPILGGVLCDSLGWGSIFWVNVPIAIVCAPLVWRMLRHHETPTAKARVDGVGLALLVVWVSALQVMLDTGKDHDWFSSPMIIGLAVIAAVGFAAFLIWELTEKTPIVQLKVFANRGFSAAMVTLALAIGAFFATNVMTPLWLQTNMGYTATWAGYVNGMIGILAVVAAPIAAQLMTKVDPRRIIFVAILWLGLIAFMRSGSNSQMGFWQIAVWLLLAGAGLPMFFMPLTGLALGSVDPKDTAGAAGLMNFVRSLASAFAASIVSTLWDNNASRSQADLAGAMQNTQSNLDALTRHGMSAGEALGSVTQLVQGQAVMQATDQVLLICAAVFVLAASAIWLAPRPAHVTTGMAH
jgi:DHA2 family multidrug resistance protein